MLPDTFLDQLYHQLTYWCVDICIALSMLHLVDFIFSVPLDKKTNCKNSFRLLVLFCYFRILQAQHIWCFGFFFLSIFRKRNIYLYSTFANNIKRYYHWTIYIYIYIYSYFVENNRYFLPTYFSFYLCPTTDLQKILTENTTILEHQNNKQKLQILEALHIKNIQLKLNRINFQTSANVLKCL